ncbi:hypothetical protein BJV77DRAFT_1143669 [Russula vinacea]|nr:hypothetical protein BJV77DRAFT_1143669 [Russula vinacea]
MRSSLPWAIITAFLGYIIWRNGRNSRNILFPTPDLPHGFYAQGPHKKQCTIVRDTLSDSMNYCEDATFWEEVNGSGALLNKVILLSCDPSRKAWNTHSGFTHPGCLPRAEADHLEGYPEAHDFHPLGLDIYPSQPDQPYSNLFVVNHARHNSTIEQFALAWDAPTRAKWLVAPNALALTSPTSFYLTHDHRFTRRLPGVLGKTLPITETLLALPLAWVTHVTLTESGTTTTTTTTVQQAYHQPGTTTTTTTTHTKTVASHIPFPNGVAISPDGTQVAIASTTLGEVLFYARDIAMQALSLRARVPTPFAPDNIMFDAFGSLIVAGHPHFPSLVAVAANRTGARAPSWVVSITPSPTPPGAEAETGAWDLYAPVSASRKVPRVPGYEMHTLYQSDGSEFSDSMTGMLYMVGLYQGGMMVCSPYIIEEPAGTCF